MVYRVYRILMYGVTVYGNVFVQGYDIVSCRVMLHATVQCGMILPGMVQCLMIHAMMHYCIVWCGNVGHDTACCYIAY